MPRRKAAEMEEDEDYDPSDSQDDPAGLQRSSRGRPVRARQFGSGSESEGVDPGRLPSHAAAAAAAAAAEEQPGPSWQGAAQTQLLHQQLQQQQQQFRAAAAQPRAKPAKRQRWVPHNPLILGGALEEEEDDSKEPQISDDDAEESGEEGASRASGRRAAAESRAKAASIPVRDESGKFIGVRPQTAAERRQATATASRGAGGGGIFKSAAVTVLREERRLMSTGEIARLALKRGYIKVQGRTPEATMASAMYTDVKRKEDRSTFIRPHEGLFGLREWLEEGTPYQDPVDDKFPEEPRGAALRRSRIGSGQSLSRAGSRGSLGAGAARQQQRSGAASPAYDPFGGLQSAGNSVRGDASAAYPDVPEIGSRQAEEAGLGLPPRLAGGGAAFGGPASTPFGRSQGGPPPEIFKSRFAAETQRQPGTVVGSRRSHSGSQLPAFTRANSGSRRRKPASGGAAGQAAAASALSQQDSGNMLLLLSAVEGAARPQRSDPGRRVGFAPRSMPGVTSAEKRLPLKRAGSGGERPPPQLLVQGFGAGRLPALRPAPLQPQQQQAQGQADQVNILNLPLPDVGCSDGSLDGPEVVPEGATTDPSGQPLPLAGLPTLRANSAAQPPPGAEAALQALDTAFASAPLPLSGSLSGPLLPAVRIPSGALPLLGTPSDLLPPELGLTGPTPSALLTTGLGGADALSLPLPDASALQLEGGSMPDFGPPEAGVRRLAEVEAAVRSMEQQLGARHPKVGKALLYLSRVYQASATPEHYAKAQHALATAYEICFACQKPPQ